MFLAALAASLLGGLMLTLWVREPRHTQPVAMAAKAVAEA
jgi:hypothetical protein